MQQAIRATQAIYSKDVKSLISLSSNELEQVFSGASVVKLLLSPGITVLELGMKANCFPTESKCMIYKLKYFCSSRDKPASSRQSRVSALARELYLHRIVVNDTILNFGVALYK